MLFTTYNSTETPGTFLPLNALDRRPKTPEYTPCLVRVAVLTDGGVS